MKQEIIDKANSILNEIKKCETKISVYKIFKSQKDVIVGRELPGDERWRYYGTESFTLDLENDELARQYYFLLLDNLIDREQQKIKQLKTEFEAL